MADFTLKAADRFPVGTTVSAYARSNWGTHELPPTGAPKGSAAGSGVVASNGSATITGLSDGVAYFAHASVSGADRYVTITPREPRDEPSGSRTTASGESIAVPRPASTAVTPKAAASVGVTSLEILAANPARVEATICNDHATNVVYLALGAVAVVNQGVRLNAAGGTYTTPPGYTGTIEAVATGASTVVTFAEV